MAHARNLIREAVRTLLSGIDGLQDHIVFDDAKIMLDEALPWCYVWLSDELIDPITVGAAPKKKRQMQMHFDLIGRDRFDVAQQCEAIGVQIENRIDGDHTLGEIVRDARLAGITIERSTDSPIQRYRMTYNVIYWTVAGTASATV